MDFSGNMWGVAGESAAFLPLLPFVPPGGLVPVALRALFGWKQGGGLSADNPAHTHHLLVISGSDAMAHLRGWWPEPSARNTPGVLLQRHLPLFFREMAVPCHTMRRGESFSLIPLPPFVEAGRDALLAHAGYRLLRALAVTSANGLPQAEEEPLRREVAQEYGISADIPALLALCATLSPPADLPPHPDAPACLPGLIALYSDFDTAILIVTDPASPLIDWPATAAFFAPRFERITVTTAALFPLIVRHQMSLTQGLGGCRHQWGSPIPGLPHPTLPDIVRSVLRTTLESAVFRLPARYLTLPEKEFPAFFHDIQNELLRIQLQYELLRLNYRLPEHLPPQMPDSRLWSNDQHFALLWRSLHDRADFYDSVLRGLQTERSFNGVDQP
jgi:hypothetical protein